MERAELGGGRAARGVDWAQERVETVTGSNMGADLIAQIYWGNHCLTWSKRTLPPYLRRPEAVLLAP